MKFLEMAFRTDRQGGMTRPTGRGKKTGDCGDTVEMFIRLEDDRVAEVRYEVNGCMHTNATANTVAELAEGRTLEAAWEITPEMVSDFLGTLPPDHFHCAELAVGAFYLALACCSKNSLNAWKHAYR